MLSLAAVAYLIAAWQLPPGFYDGLAGCPSAIQPYRWVSPPPQFKNGNQPPLGGTLEAKVGTNGVVDPGTAFTADGQARVSWLPGSFPPPADRSPVKIEVSPVASGFPDTAVLHESSNVYLIKASSAPVKDLNIVLYYQQGLPAPSTVWVAATGSNQWQALASTPTTANDCSVTASTKDLGYFTLGYPPGGGSPQSPRIGGSLLPVVTAGAILLVLLAGAPLAIMRRRARKSGTPPN